MANRQREAASSAADAAAAGACGCCCCEDCECTCCEGGFRRRFKTKAEQVAELKAYLAELKAEVQAVQERLADLRA